MLTNLQNIAQRLAGIASAMDDPAFKPLTVVKRAKLDAKIRKERAEKAEAERKRSLKEAKQKADEVFKARREQRALAEIAGATLKHKKVNLSQNGGAITVQEPDMNRKMSVQVDAKTWIFIDRDANPFEAIQRYKNRFKSPETLEKIRDKDFEHLSPGLVDILVAMGES